MTVVRYLHLLAMAFFVGGQLFLAAVVLPTSHFDQWESTTLHVKLAFVGVVAALVLWHMRRPQLHALEGAIFVGSLAIVWLGVALAH